MAQNYTLNSFIRHAANALLADYFETQGLDLGIDMRALRRNQSDRIITATSLLPDAQRAAVEQDFIAVTALGNKSGLQQIIDEARFIGTDPSLGLEAQSSVINKVFWTFLYHRPVFDGAARFAMPNAIGRYWKRHLPVTSAPGLDPASKVSSLQTALSEYFRSEEGRGRSCKVEYHARRPQHFFHAFPEDFPDAPLAWSSAGLAPHPLRPAFEVVFCYHEVEGTLDVYFEGGWRTIERLWQLFADAVLGIDRLPTLTKPSYALEPMKAPTLALVSPEDGPSIDVRIKGLRFRILDGTSTVVSVETDVTDDPKAIHVAVRRTFAEDATVDARYSLSQTRLIGVTMQATIDSGGGGRPSRRTFHLSEKSSSLKHEGHDLLLRRLLIDSGIDQTGRASSASA